jgi:hypothetical protein
MSLTELLQEMRERLDGPFADTLDAPLIRKDEAWKLKALLSEVDRLRAFESMPQGTRVRLMSECAIGTARISKGAVGTVIELARTTAFVGFDGAGDDPACCAWVPVHMLAREVAA